MKPPVYFPPIQVVVPPPVYTPPPVYVDPSVHVTPPVHVTPSVPVTPSIPVGPRPVVVPVAPRPNLVAPTPAPTPVAAAPHSLHRHAPMALFGPLPGDALPPGSDATCSALAGQIAVALQSRLSGEGISSDDATTIANAIAPLVAQQELAGGDLNDPAFLQAIQDTVSGLPLNNPLSAGNLNSILSEAVAVGSESPGDLANEADPTLANAIPCGSPSDGTPPGQGAGPDPGSVTPGLPTDPGTDPGIPGATPVNGVPAPSSPFPGSPVATAPGTPVAPAPGTPVTAAPGTPVAAAPGTTPGADDGTDPCLAPAVQEYTLVGRCTTLDAEGSDHTPTCNPTVRLVRIPAGGLAVCFSASDSTRVVFIGTKPTTVDPRSNSSLQALDRVRFIVPGDAGEKAANGTCSLGNLDKGVPATIECRAISEAGTFDGTFVTNGSRPTLAAN